MAEPGVVKYPHSNADGQPLPFTVGYLYGTIWSVVAVDTATGALTITNPDDLELVLLIWAKGCDLLFSTDGTTPALAEDTFSLVHGVIPKHGVQRIVWKSGMSIKAIPFVSGESGYIIIQAYRAWKAGGVQSLDNSL